MNIPKYMDETTVLKMTDNKKVTFLDYEFECLDDYPVGRKVDVVVRPEDIMITEPEEGQITGTITSVIFKGMHYEIIVEDGKNEIVIQNTKDGIAEDAVSAMIPEVEICMPFAELVDIEKEIERLKKEEVRLQKELARVNGMLNNEKFVSKAPQSKIDEEKEKLAKYTQMMEQVKVRLSQLA